MELEQFSGLSQWVSIILLGAAAGFIARLFFGGRGSGLLGNIVVGVLGAIIGAFIFEKLNINVNLSGLENWIANKFGVRVGFLNSLFQAVVGASLLLVVSGLFSKRRS